MKNYNDSTLYRLFLGLTILFFACSENRGYDKQSDVPKFRYTGNRVELNTDDGFKLNQFTGDSVEYLVLNSGDTIISGRPIPIKERLLNKEGLEKPIVVKAGNPIVINANRNVHVIPEDIVEIPLRLDDLIAFTSNRDTSSFPEDNLLNEINHPVEKASTGKLVKSIHPKPVAALSPEFKDNTTGDIRYLDVDQGLLSSYVLTTYEDRAGNLWFGTQSGVSRYDGKYFTHFTKEFGMSGNYVTAILEDKQGNYWFGTFSGGISKYDGEAFTHFTREQGLSNNTVRAIVEDKKGNLWFGTRGGGISMYDGRLFKHYSENQGLSNNIVYSMIEDKKGNLWIGTWGGGVSMYDGSGFRHITKKEGLLNNMVLSITEDHLGNMWFGTYGGGVSQFNGKTLKNFTESEGLSNNAILSLLEDNNHNLWIGTYGGGVNKFDGRSFTHVTEEDGLSNNNVYCIEQDRSGNLWFGTYGSGVNCYNPDGFNHFTKNSGLSHDVVYSICEDRKGNLWFGTKGEGISVYDGDKYLQYTIDQGLSSDYVTKIIEDRNGNIWMATNGGGVNKFDGSYFTHYGIKQGLSDDAVWTIAEDNSGNIWFGTKNGGACKFDGEQFTHITTAQGMSHNNVSSILIDSIGNIWFGTKGGGLNYYDGNMITRYTEKEGLADNDIRFLHITQDKKLWMAHYEMGASSYDGTYFTNHTVKEGLSKNKVWNIIEDKENRLWLGTENGLSLFTMDIDSNLSEPTYKSVVYGKDDGLKGVDFILGSAFIDSKNKAWWGTGQSLIQLDLNTFNLNKEAPKAELRNLTIDEQFIDFVSQKDSVEGVSFTGVERFYNYPHNLKLDNRNIHLTFHFSAIELVSPHKNLYTYKISGLDENWSVPSENAFADYRNLHLPGGEYTFTVMASSVSGNWGPPFEYKFTILPAWWETWWARLAYVIGAILILMAYGRWRTSSFKAHQKELERKIEKATVKIREQKDRAERSEAFKQQFLANMSHEIRTPMNAVLGMTSLTLDTKLDDKQRKYLRAVKKSSENLLVIINDILDLSKMEAGKMELEHIPFNLKEQLETVYNTLRFKAEEKGLTFKTIVGIQVPEVLIGDPSRLNQILINLAGNSIKFTEKGMVSIYVDLAEGSEDVLTFQVKDTGIGIAEDKKNRLFDAFHQVDASTSRKYGGTGLGLSISKKLIDLQGGKIDVISEEGKGSEFIFEIPYQLADVDNTYKLKKEVTLDSSALKGIRVLVVEDNEFNQIVVHDTIKQIIENASVDIAENGKVAVSRVESNDYDVVLMDVNMPEMNGHEATIQIRKLSDKSKSEIPILGLTASVLAGDIRMCLESGMNDYIPKPFKREELVGTMKKYYKQSN